ncbi:MAG TPA: PEGA domain-containing protein [Methanocorpusculum sp.]|nr:PEGA domain-containing protein [Methanocorpusculum sp.]HJK80045.1 PEGA domain-containing protein [Methanocorpusculum sp.]
MAGVLQVVRICLCILAVAAAAGCVSGVPDTDDGSPVPSYVPDTEGTDDSSGEERVGMVEVLSDPPFAAVLVDGEYAGAATPAVIPVSWGNHTIGAESSYGRVSATQVTVAGNTTVELRISPEQGTGRFLNAGILSGTGFAVVEASERAVYVSVFGRMQNAVRSGTGSVIRNMVESPYVVPGLAEGTVKITAAGGSGDSILREVPVMSGAFSPLYYMFGAGDPWENLSVSSDVYAGMRYSVDGFLSAGVLPGKREWPVSATFVSVLTPEGIVSFPRGAGNWSEMELDRREVVWHDVRVMSQPSGADIFVDGFATGYTTPWTIRNVSDGFHAIMVSKPGFLPEVQKVSFGGTGREMTIVMLTMQEYASGYVAVNSSVPGSRVVMYGRDTGDRTPVVYAGFPSGRREISVVSPDGRSRMFAVTVVPGAVNEVFADFSQ